MISRLLSKSVKKHEIILGFIEYIIINQIENI